MLVHVCMCLFVCVCFVHECESQWRRMLSILLYHSAWSLWDRVLPNQKQGVQPVICSNLPISTPTVSRLQIQKAISTFLYGCQDLNLGLHASRASTRTHWAVSSGSSLTMLVFLKDWAKGCPPWMTLADRPWWTLDGAVNIKTVHGLCSKNKPWHVDVISAKEVGGLARMAGEGACNCL